SRSVFSYNDRSSKGARFKVPAGSGQGLLSIQPLPCRCGRADSRWRHNHRLQCGECILWTDGVCRADCHPESCGGGPHTVQRHRRDMVRHSVSTKHVATYSRALILSSPLCSDIKDRFVGPCGACRQVLMEFGSDWTVYLTKPDGSYKETSLSELLPLAFSPSHLAKN
uniref:CMP/dCMP-type deaminase domain-containing protein n=1 Tax=Astatotilapia calliptera TaxID=8154 RepID=A0AAX7TG89_ASTCA